MASGKVPHEFPQGGDARVRASPVPSAVLWGLGLFQPAMRELKETDYQRDRPFILDDSAARTTFEIGPTPWSATLSAMVSSYR